MKKTKKLALFMFVAALAVAASAFGTGEAADRAPLNHLIVFDSAELLTSSKVDVSSLPLERQLAKIFDLAELTLKSEGMTLNDVIYIIAEMTDMRDRPILNEAQKKIWTTPDYYPCRIILERAATYKAGARAKLSFTATKAPHRQINSTKGQVPTGPFSRSAVVGDRVYGSGVRAIVPGTQNKVSDDLKECARQCLRNLATNMEESGTSLENAYTFTTYLSNLADVGKVLEVFKEFGIDGKKVQILFEQVDTLNEYHDVEISCSANL